MIDDQILNRIKIKDLFVAIKKELKTDEIFGLMLADAIDKREQRLLETATEEDLQEAKEFFIQRKLNIKYFASQNKKFMNGKVIPIDQIFELTPTLSF